MSARIVRSSGFEAHARSPARLSHNSSPMSKGANSQMIMYGGIGLALGAGFLLLMSRPDVAKDQPIDGVTNKPVSPK
ncbi:hypothetical protein NXS19_008596 [Fusarium pseudograminearum]|nr:hypothetical protein NXS19_008596 [Fusarium pseudograminearum]